MRAFVYRIFLVLIFLLLTIQVLDFISIAGEKPDLLLILTLFVAQKKGVMEGQLTGFFSGLAEDLFSIQLFGIHSFCKLILGSLAGLIHSNFVVDNFAVRALMGFFASVIHGFLFVAAKLVFDSMDVGHYLLHSLWIKVLYTTLLTPVFFWVLEFFEKKFGES